MLRKGGVEPGAALFLAMNPRTRAPEARRTRVKVHASMAPAPRAARQSRELRAKLMRAARVRAMTRDSTTRRPGGGGARPVWQNQGLQ